MQCAVCMSCCRMRTPSQRRAENVENCERRCTEPWTLQRWREHCAQVFEGGGFSQGLASPLHRADLENGDDCFIVGRQKGREHALDLLQAVYGEQSCHLGTRAIALSSSHVPGKNTDTAKAGDRVRAGQTARSTLIESTSADRCSMCCHPGN